MRKQLGVLAAMLVGMGLAIAGWQAPPTQGVAAPAPAQPTNPGSDANGNALRRATSPGSSPATCRNGRAGGTKCPSMPIC